VYHEKERAMSKHIVIPCTNMVDKPSYVDLTQPLYKISYLHKRSSHSYECCTEFKGMVELVGGVGYHSIYSFNRLDVDYMVASPCWHLEANYGVHCPVCLEKFLRSGKPFAVDYKGDLLDRSWPTPWYGDGLVRKLHWGHEGVVGICYVCAGRPDEQPHW
jgi:hypothetical protein